MEPSARLDMTAEVRSLACDLLAQTDLFYLHDECSGSVSLALAYTIAY